MEGKIDSEIAGVSKTTDSVRRENEAQFRELSSAIDGVNTTVDERVSTEMTRVKEYVDEKCRPVQGVMQLAKKNSEVISQVKTKLDEIQQGLALTQSAISRVSDSVKEGEAVLVTTPQAGPSGRVDTNLLPNLDINSRNGRLDCQDGVSTVSPPETSSVNVMSEKGNKGVELSELTLPLFNDSRKQVPLLFIRDLDLYFKLRQTPNCLNNCKLSRTLAEFAADKQASK
jgi:hypothetical protein